MLARLLAVGRQIYPIALSGYVPETKYCKKIEDASDVILEGQSKCCYVDEVI